MAEFDPGRMARRLQAAGASDDLAEAVADEVNGAVGGLATRADLEVLRADMRADMQALRADVRADLEVFRAEMRADMQAFQAEMRVLLAEMRADFQKELRILALQLGGFAVGVAGIAVAIVKLA